MELNTNSISKSALRGSAMGVLFMALFGTLWAHTGVIGLNGWGYPYTEFIIILVGIILIIGVISLFRASRNLTNQFSEEEVTRGRRVRFWFNTIFLAEGLIIAITIIICNTVNHTDIIPAVIAIIVGIHFIPLASLFQVKIYYATGTLLCLLAVITLLFVPEIVTIKQHDIVAPMTTLGIASALILWITGLIIWLMTTRLQKVSEIK